MMLPTPISALAASALALLQVTLMLRVSARRAATQTGVGDGGDASLTKRMRAHGNLAENGALFLVLLYLAEASGRSSTVLSAVATVFVAARLSHAVGISRSAGAGPLRFFGATVTALSLVALSGMLLFSGMSSLTGSN